MIESSLRGNIVYIENLDPDVWPVEVDLAELNLRLLMLQSMPAMPCQAVAPSLYR